MLAWWAPPTSPGDWRVARPACVTPEGYYIAGMATLRVEGEGQQQQPAGVTLPPRGEEIPWPARLVQMAASENDASSEPPAFQRRTKAQRRLMQRKLSKAIKSAQAGPASGGLAQPRLPTGVSAGTPGWEVRGHLIVQAAVRGPDGQNHADLLFCKECGGSVHQTVPHWSARGLAGTCLGPKHRGLKTHRSKLRRGLFPGHILGAAVIGPAFEPTQEMKAVWGPQLDVSAPARAAAGSGEAGGGPESAEAPGRLVDSRSSATGGGSQAGPHLPPPPVLDASHVAQLHGSASPEELVQWERSRQLHDVSGSDGGDLGEDD